MATIVATVLLFGIVDNCCCKTKKEEPGQKNKRNLQDGKIIRATSLQRTKSKEGKQLMLDSFGSDPDQNHKGYQGIHHLIDKDIDDDDLSVRSIR